MDRTLVRKNTAQLYVRYQREIGEASLFDVVRIAYWVGQYTLGIVDAEKVAKRVLQTLINTREEVLIERCNYWFKRDVAPHVTSAARRIVEQHLKAGDFCAIVTTATRYAAAPLASMLEIPHVVATELEVDSTGRFTGNFIAPLCYGPGKIIRANQLVQSQNLSLDQAVFYSDSISDLPLLERVKTPIAVNPDPRLSRIARTRGWQREYWK